MMATKEQQRAWSKKWAKEHPEKIKEIAKKYREKHGAKIYAARKKYRSENRAKLDAAKRKWEVENPDMVALQRVRARIREMNGALGRSLRYHYDITVDRYREILVMQEGKCAICKKPPVHTKRLYVDHDHNTGVVRGLLCHHCNFGIGHFWDRPQLLLNACEYLLSFFGTENADWVQRVRTTMARLNGEAHSATSCGNDQRSTIAAD